ncbi:hypothetical protein SLA2020_461920 [Shorea laevis]
MLFNISKLSPPQSLINCRISSLLCSIGFLRMGENRRRLLRRIQEIMAGDFQEISPRAGGILPRDSKAAGWGEFDGEIEGNGGCEGSDLVGRANIAFGC